MALVTAVLNDALFSVASDLVSLSLHTGDPGSTGANEVSGGSYARGTLDWPTPASGSMSDDLSIAVPGGTTVGWVGFWDSSATWMGGQATAAQETWNSDGTADVSVTATAANA